ncbi:MAG: FAD-dependent oxidoreductase [Sedimentisphaerales bacterium]|nr:FAD-dependent oxidoreductase [Sedimentisphaerales bacterium]
MSKGKKVLIVGGVAGGASAAARARRLNEEAEIVVFERGEYISFANCGLPYHIGEIIKDRKKLLVQTPEAMRERFNIDVRVNSEVISIDRKKKQVTVHDLAGGTEYNESYDALVLSPGAFPFVPPTEGGDSKRIFTLRNIPDMDAIKAVVDNDKPGRAVVIGGGFIGLEMAEVLAARGVEVAIVELAGQVFAPVDPEMAAPIHQELLLKGVDVQLNTSVEKFVEQGDKITAHLKNGRTIEASLVIMAIGVKPETALAKAAGLAIGERGGISVDEHMLTSDPNIYAVGDAVEVTDFVGGHKTLVPLAGPANRQGRIAADNIFGKETTYKDTQGTAVCKIFDITAGATGMNERMLERSGAAFEKIYVHSSSNAGYYPGAAPMAFKLLFDPKNGKVLGTQIVGTKGVDKRIDVMAVAIRTGLTVHQLGDLELSYAPPYGSAKDPVNYAGFVASNVMEGLIENCHTEDIEKITDNQLLVDVRTAGEFERGAIEGTVNIPVDELRSRLGDIPKDKELIVYCQTGLRSYIACRVLSQNGFKCRNLSGGYKTYKAKKHLGLNIKPNKPMQKPNTNGGNTMIKKIDVCGLQCPGPIMQVKKELEQIDEGQVIEVASTDAGFAADIPAWCRSTGNRCTSVTSKDGVYYATVVKGRQQTSCAMADVDRNHKTIVVFSNDFDKAMAAFIIANGAAAMGSEVTMFFTFWGINLLRKKEKIFVKKNLIEKMFGFMMPKGDRSGLSKMNMGGMGKAMIRRIMKKKNVMPLPELMGSAKKNGVKLVACAMSMDLMGIKEEELIDGVETGGVAMYLDRANAGNVNLFI